MTTAPIRPPPKAAADADLVHRLRPPVGRRIAGLFPDPGRQPGRPDRRRRRRQFQDRRGPGNRRAGADAVAVQGRRAWSRPGTPAPAAARRSPGCSPARSTRPAACRSPSRQAPTSCRAPHRRRSRPARGYGRRRLRHRRRGGRLQVVRQEGHQPLFAFGHGLSYSTFGYERPEDQHGLAAASTVELQGTTATPARPPARTSRRVSCRTHGRIGLEAPRAAWPASVKVVPASARRRAWWLQRHHRPPGAFHGHLQAPSAKTWNIAAGASRSVAGRLVSRTWTPRPSVTLAGPTTLPVCVRRQVGPWAEPRKRAPPNPRQAHLSSDERAAQRPGPTLELRRFRRSRTRRTLRA